MSFVSPEPANDKWLRIIGIPVAALPFVWTYLEEFGYSWRLFALIYACELLTTAAVWHLLRWWVMWVRQRYTHKSQTSRRVLITAGGYSLFTIPIQAGETWLINQIDWMGLNAQPAFPGLYLIQVFVALTFLAIVGSYYETSYYLHLYRLAVAESEAIQKASLQSQFDSLKNQVNPHFLFNSLNSLSALIWEDRQKAGEFLDELASVYRYLLQMNQYRLVSLKAELDFIRAYIYLLQTRYGAALDCQFSIDESLLNRTLPPLTLQTLVENAIRHNVIEVGQPLRIGIEASHNLLTISNSIQRKSRSLNTQPGGLSHVTTLYASLNLPLPQVTDDGQTFKVQVSLAQKKEESLLVLP
ncbi:sensor histidine kinase [Tellurirhabdus bombi]|uniref:sensor histidine kinase n=1 Tax=Tellurirhabdus bombi TaxID=2907205 RepID=UPI001F2CE63E|nr:histidine kinase [Tellurirhabdus bombi]